MEESLSLKISNTKKRTECFQKHLEAPQHEYWWAKKRTLGFLKCLSEWWSWAPLHLNDDLGSLPYVRQHWAVIPGWVSGGVPQAGGSIAALRAWFSAMLKGLSSPGPEVVHLSRAALLWKCLSKQLHLGKDPPCHIKLLSTDMPIWSWDKFVMRCLATKCRQVGYGVIKIT